MLSFRCFQKAARFLLGENASCNLVCLTALQSAHRWTVEKRNTERVKNKGIKYIFRVENDFFTTTRGMGKKLRAKQNRDGSLRFFEATKKIEPLEKTKRGLKHKCVLY